MIFRQNKTNIHIFILFKSLMHGFSFHPSIPPSLPPNTTTEVLPGRRSRNGCPLLWVCVCVHYCVHIGWVKWAQIHQPYLAICHFTSIYCFVYPSSLPTVCLSFFLCQCNVLFVGLSSLSIIQSFVLSIHQNAIILAFYHSFYHSIDQPIHQPHIKKVSVR